MDGLLASLYADDLATYFPDRQFVERHLVERQVINPGTGEMSCSRVWTPIDEPASISADVEFPTAHELQSLNELKWITTPFDHYILASLIALLAEPAKWEEQIKETYNEILRFESHPSVQCETVYRIPKQIRKPLVKTAEFDFRSESFDRQLVDFRYFKDMDRSRQLCDQITAVAKESLKPDNILILWCRGDY